MVDPGHTDALPAADLFTFQNHISPVLHIGEGVQQGVNELELLLVEFQEDGL